MSKKTQNISFLTSDTKTMTAKKYFKVYYQLNKPWSYSTVDQG